MKVISAILLTLTTGAALMAAAVSPAAGEKKDTTAANNTVSITKVQQPIQANEFNGAIRVIAPQKDLESAIRASEKGDVLLLGHEGWYRIEGKTLQNGTKVYVLGPQGSLVSAFPKDAADPVR
jgi:hypothetical protein